MNKILTLIVTSLLFLGVISGCSSKTDNAETFISYDIVKLEAQGASGTSFVLYRPNSDDPIVYTDSRKVINTSLVPVGNRLMLGYIPAGAPYQSGPITAQGYSVINNDTLRVYAPEVFDNDDWRRDGIYIYSIWRTGPYLNVHGKVAFTDVAILRLGMVETDLEDNTPVPTLYLLYRMNNPVDNFEREFYASFDMSNLWENEWCEGIEVNVENTNLLQDKFIFSKQ